MIVMWEDDGSAIIFFSNDTIISSVDEIMAPKREQQSGAANHQGKHWKPIALCFILLFFVQGSFVLDHSILLSLQPSRPVNLQEKDQAVLPSLSELLNRSGSDKYWRHRYDHYYVRWFEPYRRLADLSMLEIGVQKARSLAFWNEYFLYPKRILGLAYGPDSTGVEEAVAGSLSSNSKVQVIRGDQSKVETMDVLKQMGPYDIIVDDGSHVPSHMIFTLFHLWQSVRPGGLYLIEDLETNYWKEGSVLYGYTFQGTGFGKPAQTNAIEKVKQLVDILARNQIGATTQDEGLSIMPGDDQLCSIEFGKNVLALRKCSEYEMEHQPRVQAKVYDEKLLKDWLVKAKASNPIGFKI